MKYGAAILQEIYAETPKDECAFCGENIQQVGKVGGRHGGRKRRICENILCKIEHHRVYIRGYKRWRRQNANSENAARQAGTAGESGKQRNGSIGTAGEPALVT